MHKYQFPVTYKDRKHIQMLVKRLYTHIKNQTYFILWTKKQLMFLFYTNKSILALSWDLTMHTAMSHINCLISALWLHCITYKGSKIQYALLHSVTETSHKSIDMLYKNTLGVKKARPSQRHQLLLFSACN